MDWESFKQDIVNQRVYSWLIEMGKNEEAKRVYSIHNWMRLYSTALLAKTAGRKECTR